MPFDPNVPVHNAELTSAMFRGQFQGLKALIDAIQGGITSVVVDAVNTVPPGTPANVGMSLSGTELHFTFDIPQGNDGAQGQQGNDGQQGPPFAQAVVDSVNTLPAGSAASVGVSFDGTNVRFTFDIPQGQEGPMGATGEVSQGQLDSAISGTSNNSNGVGTLDNSFGDPASEELRNKMNELINALRR